MLRKYIKLVPSGDGLCPKIGHRFQAKNKHYALYMNIQIAYLRDHLSWLASASSQFLVEVMA